MQLIVMNEVPFSSVRQALGLSFIVWYRSEPKVLINQFLLVQDRAGRLSDNCYLQSRFLALASWPGRSPWVSIRPGNGRQSWVIFLEPNRWLDKVLYKHA
jgi:hypothetical protein